VSPSVAMGAPSGAPSSSSSCVAMGVPWLRHGCAMVAPWACHGGAMGGAMGGTMGASWVRHGCVMGASWVRHGRVMVSPSVAECRQGGAECRRVSPSVAEWRRVSPSGVMDGPWLHMGGGAMVPPRIGRDQFFCKKIKKTCPASTRA
jgi:hypothetical protein